MNTEFILAAVTRQCNPDTMPRILAKLLINEVFPKLDAEGTAIEDIEVYHLGMTEMIADCARLLSINLLKPRQVKKMIADCWGYPFVGYGIIQYLGETDLLDEAPADALLQAIDEALAANTKAVAEYRAGKEKAIGAIVGAVLKKVKADPAEVQVLIKEKLKTS